MLSTKASFSSMAMVLALVTFTFEEAGASRANQNAQVKRCDVDVITTTINVPYLEQHMAGDVLVTCSAVSKLHCEDMCLRNPHCEGFNFNVKKQECEILSEVYNAYVKEVSRATRAFMRTFLLGRGGCIDIK
ncbi:hypothetical protein OS493_033330 [Desmophyllum pertusum]|uniref:Apple domain-containing protein n=1 Tax=Desmophyllum pertusum TaxID=174260 RepID=A0A9X0CUP8_9CNID|nr:hypothetical protein OS493_033330 [Desmophyllum pertusum]